MRILKKGSFADVLRFDPNESYSSGEYHYIVQIRNNDGTKIFIPCLDFTGASILMDVLDRVLPAPILIVKK